MYEAEISECRRNINIFRNKIAELKEEISDLENCAGRMAGKVGEVDGLKNNLLEKIQKISSIDAGLAIQEKIRTVMTAAVSGPAYVSFSQSVTSGGADIGKEIECRESEIEDIRRKIAGEEQRISQYASMADEMGEDFQNG